MIAAPPPVAITVNGRSVGTIGVRWRGPNPSVGAMNKVLQRCGLQSVRHKGEGRQLYRQLGAIARARGVARRTLRRNPGEMCSRCGRTWLLRGGVCSGCKEREARLKNPRTGEVEIYSNVERIYAKKGRRSTVPGQPFVHNFRHASAHGRPDGTVVLRGRGGRRLWDFFRA